MIHVENNTGLPHLVFEKQGPEGETLEVLVVRATFDMASDGRLVTLAAQQRPIAFADRFEGPLTPHPLGAVLAEEGDLVVFKPGTDVTVQGAAYAPNAQPRPYWYARITVGPVSKAVRLSGPRWFTRGLFGWRASEPQPVTHVALDDRLAYGGHLDMPADMSDSCLSFPENPAGRGWLPSAADLEALDKPARRALKAHLAGLREIPAPQIEPALRPHKKPGFDGHYANLTGRARWTASRLAYQGTLDDAWMAQRYPLLPKDFDSRFYQAAPADQVCQPWLSGKESLTLEGLLPEPRCVMRLPGWQALVAAETIGGVAFVVQPVLDTLRVDLDTRQISLLWRAHFRPEEAVSRLALAMTDQPLDLTTSTLPELAS